MVVLRCWWLWLLGATVVVAAATVVVVVVSLSGVGACSHSAGGLGVRFSSVTLPARVARVDLVRAARTKPDGVSAAVFGVVTSPSEIVRAGLVVSAAEFDSYRLRSHRTRLRRVGAVEQNFRGYVCAGCGEGGSRHWVLPALGPVRHSGGDQE